MWNASILGYDCGLTVRQLGEAIAVVVCDRSSWLEAVKAHNVELMSDG